MFRVIVFILLCVMEFCFVSPCDIQLSHKHFYLPHEAEMQNLIGANNNMACLQRVCKTPQADCVLLPKGCADCCTVCQNQGGGYICSAPIYQGRNCQGSGIIACGQHLKGDCVPAGKLSVCIGFYAIGNCGNLYQNCTD